MVSYSQPFNLKKFGPGWITTEKDWWTLDKLLEKSPHLPIAPKKQLNNLRPVGKTEIAMGKVVEWPRS